MADLKFVAMDLEKEVDGVWVRYPSTDIEVLIARLNNPRFEDATRPYKRRMQKMLRDESVEDREMLESLRVPFCEFVLLDWKNVQMGEKVIEYSKGFAQDLFKKREFFDFYRWIFSQAAEFDNFRQANLDDDSGNSPDSSATS